MLYEFHQEPRHGSHWRQFFLFGHCEIYILYETISITAAMEGQVLLLYPTLLSLRFALHYDISLVEKLQTPQTFYCFYNSETQHLRFFELHQHVLEDLYGQLYPQASEQRMRHASIPLK